MRIINIKKIICLPVMLFLTALTLYAQKELPIPAGNINQLFYLQRTANTNTIVYELNYDNNTLNSKDPVHVFWIRYDEQGQKSELNYFQRKFAYGIKCALIAKEKYQLHIVSYKNFPMVLAKGENNKYNVYATINQKQAILNRIFVKINGGSLWTPNVEYVEVEGIDLATGEEITERLKI